MKKSDFEWMNEAELFDCINNLEEVNRKKQELINSIQKDVANAMEQVVYLQEETIKLSGMIDNGLGWEDLKEDVNGK